MLRPPQQPMRSSPPATRSHTTPHLHSPPISDRFADPASAARSVSAIPLDHQLEWRKEWLHAARWSACPETIAAGTTVTVAGAVQAAGVNVAAGGRLTFDPNSASTLSSTKNIIVEGALSMRPASAAVVQTIRFTGVDAS